MRAAFFSNREEGSLPLSAGAVALAVESLKAIASAIRDVLTSLPNPTKHIDESAVLPMFPLHESDSASAEAEGNVIRALRENLSGSMEAMTNVATAAVQQKQMSRRDALQPELGNLAKHLKDILALVATYERTTTSDSNPSDASALSETNRTPPNRSARHRGASKKLTEEEESTDEIKSIVALHQAICAQECVPGFETLYSELLNLRQQVKGHVAERSDWARGMIASQHRALLDELVSLEKARASAAHRVSAFDMIENGGQPRLTADAMLEELQKLSRLRVRLREEWEAATVTLTTPTDDHSEKQGGTNISSSSRRSVRLVAPSASAENCLREVRQLVENRNADAVRELQATREALHEAQSRIRALEQAHAVAQCHVQALQAAATTAAVAVSTTDSTSPVCVLSGALHRLTHEAQLRAAQSQKHLTAFAGAVLGDEVERVTFSVAQVDNHHTVAEVYFKGPTPSLANTRAPGVDASMEHGPHLRFPLFPVGDADGLVHDAVLARLELVVARHRRKAFAAAPAVAAAPASTPDPPAAARGGGLEGTRAPNHTSAAPTLVSTLEKVTTSVPSLPVSTSVFCDDPFEEPEEVATKMADETVLVADVVLRDGNDDESYNEGPRDGGCANDTTQGVGCVSTVVLQVGDPLLPTSPPEEQEQPPTLHGHGTESEAPRVHTEIHSVAESRSRKRSRSVSPDSTRLPVVPVAGTAETTMATDAAAPPEATVPSPFPQQWPATPLLFSAAATASWTEPEARAPTESEDVIEQETTGGNKENEATVAAAAAATGASSTVTDVPPPSPQQQQPQQLPVESLMPASASRQPETVTDSATVAVGGSSCTPQGLEQTPSQQPPQTNARPCSATPAASVTPQAIFADDDFWDS